MATLPPQSPAGQPMSADDQDPTAGAPGAPDDAQGDGSYVIEIRVSGSKEITVCVEEGSEEAGEEAGADGGDADSYGASGAGGGDDNSVPVKSIKEALTLALEIFRNDGELPQQADDDFQQGFQGANS